MWMNIKNDFHVLWVIVKTHFKTMEHQDTSTRFQCEMYKKCISKLWTIPGPCQHTNSGLLSAFIRMILQCQLTGTNIWYGSGGPVPIAWTPLCTLKKLHRAEKQNRKERQFVFFQFMIFPGEDTIHNYSSKSFMRTCCAVCCQRWNIMINTVWFPLSQMGMYA